MGGLYVLFPHCISLLGIHVCSEGLLTHLFFPGCVNLVGGLANLAWSSSDPLERSPFFAKFRHFPSKCRHFSPKCRRFSSTCCRFSATCCHFSPDVFIFDKKLPNIAKSDRKFPIFVWARAPGPGKSRPSASRGPGPGPSVRAW